jgi:anti-anti-sigma factor
MMMAISGESGKNAADAVSREEAMLRKLAPRECARPFREDGGLTVLACLEPGADLLRQVRDLEEAEAGLKGEVDFYLAEEDCLGVLRQSYQVAGTPTFILFQDGREVDRRIGRLSQKDLEHFAIKKTLAPNARPVETAEAGAPGLDVDDNRAMVYLPSEMTLEQSQNLKREMTPLMVKAPVANVVLDLSRVHRMDSSGLGVLVHWNTQLATYGKSMHLFRASAPVRKCLSIAALSDFFHYLETEDDLNFLD